MTEKKYMNILKNLNGRKVELQSLCDFVVDLVDFDGTAGEREIKEDEIITGEIINQCGSTFGIDCLDGVRLYGFELIDVKITFLDN